MCIYYVQTMNNQMSYTIFF